MASATISLLIAWTHHCAAMIWEFPITTIGLWLDLIKRENRNSKNSEFEIEDRESQRLGRKQRNLPEQIFLLSGPEAHWAGRKSLSGNLIGRMDRRSSRFGFSRIQLFFCFSFLFISRLRRLELVESRRSDDVLSWNSTSLHSVSATHYVRRVDLGLVSSMPSANRQHNNKRANNLRAKRTTLWSLCNERVTR